MITINGKHYEINIENAKISKYDHQYCTFLKNHLEKRDLFDPIDILDEEKLININNVLRKYQKMCEIEKYISDNYDKYRVEKVNINGKIEDIKYNTVETYYNKLVKRINIRKNSKTHNLYDKKSASYKSLQLLIEYKLLFDFMLTKEKDDTLLCNKDYIGVFDISTLDEEKSNVK